MGDTRFKGGLAYGPYANFYANTANVFAQADATPDVTNGNLFFSNNTSTTVITNFDLTVTGGGAGSNAGAFEGKVIRVIFLDNSTSLANASPLILATSDNLQGANNSIELLYHNSSWIEFNRSQNQSNFITVSSVAWLTVSNVVPNASTGNVIIGGRGPHVTLNLVQDSTGQLSLRRAIGGYDGQLLTIVAGGDSAANVIVNSAAVDTFVCQSSASSTQFRLAGSNSVTFVKYLSKWHEITPAWMNSSQGLSS